MDFEAVGIKRKMQLSKMDEWHENSFHNAKIYRERIKRWHDKSIKKEFGLRDKVLLFNSKVKLFGHGELWSKWKGTFKVISTSSHGAVTFKMLKVRYSR
jgi:hypothetical protein